MQAHYIGTGYPHHQQMGAGGGNAARMKFTCGQIAYWLRCGQRPHSGELLNCAQGAIQ
jgi:hypothetical protein